MANASERESELAKSLEDRAIGVVAWESTLCVLLVLSAFLGNALLCLSLYKTRGFRSPQNYYITSLAVTDMLFGGLCMSFSFGALTEGKWIYGETLCQVQGSLIFILVCASVFTMTLIAINRFFKICKSIDVYRKLYVRRNILLSIALAWVLSTVVVVAVFSFTNRPFRFHPGKFCCYLDMAYSQGVNLYTLCAYLAVSVIVFPTMTFCYFRVYKTVREHFAEMAKSEVVQDASRSFINEAKITKMLFITLVAFLACWTPSICLDIFEAFNGQYSLPRRLYFWQIVTFACSSVVMWAFLPCRLLISDKTLLSGCLAFPQG